MFSPNYLLPEESSLQGTFAARVAGSLLTAIELPELIAKTEKEYEALALSLAIDPNKFRSIKSKLANKKNSATLFDTKTYTKKKSATVMIVCDSTKISIFGENLGFRRKISIFGENLGFRKKSRFSAKISASGENLGL